MVHPTSEHALASFHYDRKDMDPAWEVAILGPRQGVRAHVWEAFNLKGLKSAKYFGDRMYRGLDRNDNNYPEGI
jgi:hypothetical protein